jgi:hypothetical protein
MPPVSSPRVQTLTLKAATYTLNDPLNQVLKRTFIRRFDALESQGPFVAIDVYTIQDQEVKMYTAGSTPGVPGTRNDRCCHQASKEIFRRTPGSHLLLMETVMENKLACYDLPFWHWAQSDAAVSCVFKRALERRFSFANRMFTEAGLSAAQAAPLLHPS